MVLGLAFLPALGNFGGGLLADILYGYAKIVNMKEKGDQGRENASLHFI